jgi:hypothetical protein
VVFIEGPPDDCWVSVLDSPFGWTYTLRTVGEDIAHFDSDQAALDAAVPVAREIEEAEYVPGGGDFDGELARFRERPRHRVEHVRFLYWNDGNGAYDDLLTLPLSEAQRVLAEILEQDE